MKLLLNRIVLTALVLSVPLAASAADEVVVRGGGWGHGIGMSQYGARAMAEDGKTAEEITSHFYTGSTSATVGEGSLVGHADPLRIGIIQKETDFAFEPVNGPVALCAGEECMWTALPGDGLDWSYRSDGEGYCQFYNGDVPLGNKGPCVGELTWTDQPNTRVTVPQINRTYARGQILLRPAPDGLFHVLVELDLEEYLYGLAEMPSSWPAEALKAQAIAGRTYALYKAWIWRKIGTGSESTSGELRRVEDCACHLYSTTHDQSYKGWAKEGEFGGGVDWGAKWVAAVDATAGEALTHSASGGRALQAFYSSSTGGATENNEDVWGGSPVPYLRSVTDPGATTWSESFTRDKFAQALDLICVGRADITGTFVSGSPSQITIEGSDASRPVVTTYTGREFRSALGLRSHYVTSVEGLQLGPTGGAEGDHLLKYRSSDGAYWYQDVDAAGCTLRLIRASEFEADWTHVEAIDLDGDDDEELLFYRSSDGRYEYRSLNADGTLGSVRSEGNWAPGWTAVEPVRFEGDARDELMFYRVSDGRFAYYDIKVNGEIGTAVRVGYFGPGWTSSEPLDINGDGIDEMFFYRKGDGRFAYYYLRSDGTIGHSVRKGNFGTGWDIIEPTDFDGDATDEMLYYRVSDGRYAIYDLSLGGHIGSSLGVGNYVSSLVAVTSPRSN